MKNCCCFLLDFNVDIFPTITSFHINDTLTEIKVLALLGHQFPNLSDTCIMKVNSLNENRFEERWRVRLIFNKSLQEQSVFVSSSIIS